MDGRETLTYLKEMWGWAHTIWEMPTWRNACRLYAACFEPMYNWS